MPCQLPADCLNEIFEYLEEEKITLRSCLLVNRLWCQVAIRILWRNIWSIQRYKPCQTAPLSIISTLVACLPEESKKLIYSNGIVISTPTCKPPMFNYAAFVKVLSINDIDYMINHVINPITSQNIRYKKYLILQEFIKMFMIQIHSLNILDYTFIYFKTIPNLPNIPLTYFPGATNCLTNLSELRCNTNNSTEFFYHLIQICYNIKYLTINFENIMSSGLIDLISSQKNLKHLKLVQSYDGVYWSDIVPSLTKHSMTLTKLDLVSSAQDVPISFISLFSNLQELNITFYEEGYFEDFKELQHLIFPKLHVLKIPYQCPDPEYVMKFLENNGKNLKVFKIGMDDKLLNLSIAKFCPNLKELFLLLKYDELETLKTIFKNCKYLESIELWCGESFNEKYLKEKELFDAIADYSPPNFYKLKFYNVDNDSKLFPKDLDSFLTSWKNRKLFSLIINFKGYCGDFFLGGSRDVHEEIINIIEKYKNFGIVKKFEVKVIDYDE